MNFAPETGLAGPDLQPADRGLGLWGVPAHNRLEIGHDARQFHAKPDLFAVIDGDCGYNRQDLPA